MSRGDRRKFKILCPHQLDMRGIPQRLEAVLRTRSNKIQVRRG